MLLFKLVCGQWFHPLLGDKKSSSMSPEDVGVVLKDASASGAIWPEAVKDLVSSRFKELVQELISVDDDESQEGLKEVRCLQCRVFSCQFFLNKLFALVL